MAPARFSIFSAEVDEEEDRDFEGEAEPLDPTLLSLSSGVLRPPSPAIIVLDTFRNGEVAIVQDQLAKSSPILVKLAEIFYNQQNSQGNWGYPKNSQDVITIF